MKEEEKLYEVLGELIFAIAMADGIIQDEERAALKRLLENHPFGAQIKWSFDYEESKHHSAEAIYEKVINYCQGHGPSHVYTEFIDAMKLIAEAAEGVDPKEEKMINSFSKRLMERFQKDAEALFRFKNDLSD